MNFIYIILVSLIPGLIFLGCTINIININNECNVMIPATLIGFEIYRGEDSTSYCPIYRYSYDSKAYQNKARLNVKKQYYKNAIVGETYSIFINPTNPGMFIANRLNETERKRKFIAPIILMILPWVLIAIIAIVFQILL